MKFNFDISLKSKRVKLSLKIYSEIHVSMFVDLCTFNIGKLE